jgi:hypothetical protein
MGGNGEDQNPRRVPVVRVEEFNLTVRIYHSIRMWRVTVRERNGNVTISLTERK